MLKKLTVPFMAMALLVTGCIRTDSSMCVSGIDLTFDYVLNPDEVDKFDTAVAKVSVFAFDEFGTYYGSGEATVDEIIQNGRKMRLPFPKGNYTILVWGGMLDTYTIGEKIGDNLREGLEKGVSKIETFRIWLNEDADKPAAAYPYAEIPTDLFFGRGGIQVENTRASEFNISLIKNTQTIKIVFVEKEGTRSGSRAGGELPYGLFVHGNNTRLNERNSITESAPEYIYEALSAGENTADGYEVKFKTMRLERTKTESLKLDLPELHDIEIPDDGNIVKMIRSLKDENNTNIYPDQTSMDKEDEFEIRLEVLFVPGTGKILEVIVSINGWVYTKVIPIIP